MFHSSFILRYAYVACLLAFLRCSVPSNDKQGLSPLQALKSFELADEFQIELFAAEPLIADPVAMEVDEKGDIYVVEMHGYPEDLKGSGIVKLLRDTDADGKPDKADVFADSLVLPSGIMKWKKGVLVVDVPHVWYLEDSNNDGKADIKQKMLTGFALTNPQHIANTPLLGIDNWIYIAHQGAITPKVSMIFNDTGTNVRFVNNPQAVQLPRDAEGRNIRFRPNTYELEMLAGESQYGHSFDNWGHHFCTSNADHLFAEIIAARYLKRNPSLLVADATENIPDHGDAAEVFPITNNPEHQLLTDVGVITSSCGITYYQGGLFPDSFNNITFIAEPVHNLVHADRIQSKGASFTASRVYQGKEFLASKDAWFRPVQFYIGPDGALYVIDYYRQIVEHPEWMSEEVNKSGALYNGSDKGRIYRITPKGTGSAQWPNSIKIGNKIEELVSLLSNKNIWWRRTAQRLLADNSDNKRFASLKNYVDTSQSAEGTVHALWLLEYNRQSDSSAITKALMHPVSGVRENALKIAELNINRWPGLADAILKLADDADARVRFQLLCSLGGIDSEKSESVRMQLLKSGIEDRWVQIAMLSGIAAREWQVLSTAIEQFSFNPSEGRRLFFENCAALIALNRKAVDIKKAIAVATVSKDTGAAWWQSAILGGLHKGISVRGRPEVDFFKEESALLKTFQPSSPAILRHAAIELIRELGISSNKQLKDIVTKAVKIAADSNAEMEFRKDAIRLLALDKSGANIALLERLIDPVQAEILQEQAVKTYTELDAMKAAIYFIEKWRQMIPTVREAAMDVFFTSPKTEGILLDALEKGQLQAGSLGWQRSVWLMNEDDSTIRNRARRILGNRNSNRSEIIKKYEEALNAEADAIKGKELFKINCSVCHQVNGKDGKPFGPDLASIRNRDARFILADILDPNRSIADTYELWTLTKKDGKKLGGIVSAKTSESITITGIGGISETILRSDIAQLEASNISAMPVGLESAISIKDMANLLAFLKGKK